MATGRRNCIISKVAIGDRPRHGGPTISTESKELHPPTFALSGPNIETRGDDRKGDMRPSLARANAEAV
jgi:hypothetical protein